MTYSITDGTTFFTQELVAFACNAKRFAIAILCFLFLIPSAVFGRTAKSFLANV